jgi:sugar phosphate isomerase/epimerase
MNQTRRTLLQSLGLLASTLTVDMTYADANPLDRPIGLQLYTVGDELDKDFHGTLKRISAIGYKEVELAQTHSKTAAQLRNAFHGAGLRCRSAHMFDPKQSPAQFMDFANELGVKYVVTSFNPPPSLMTAMSAPNPDFAALVTGLQQMTLDEYKKSAQTANELGAEAKKRGLQYLYHNHNLEFKKFGDTTGYDTLLASTDPELVKMELDCGWMTAAGHDPVTYIDKYPGRYRLLHIKAFKPGEASLNLGGTGAPAPTELGKGVPDYKPIFAAARKAGVEQYYVEQEPPFTDMPALEAIKVDYDFLHKMDV